MSKFGYLSEESAEEFVSNVNKGNALKQKLDNLKNETSIESSIRKKQIERELNNLDNWFDGKKE